MKMKWSSVLCLCLIIASIAAFSEEADPFFEAFDGMEWSFLSGAGAWSTDLRILPDGTFSGEYHDSEMGESADAYPNGTVYGCSFTGRFGNVQQVSETVWNVTVESLVPDVTPGDESVEDGIRYVGAEPYGLSEGDQMLLCAPGTPLDQIPNDLLLWTHIRETETAEGTLEAWFLASEQNGSGFVGEEAPEWTGLANPWREIGEEELLEVSGLAFQVPEGAENVVLRYMDSKGMAEMQFTMNGDSFCARLLPAQLEEGELMDISGMYFAWEYEESVEIRGMKGTLGLARTGSEDWVERCLWYDASASVMHSLSAATTNPDGLDLTALADACMP